MTRCTAEIRIRMRDAAHAETVLAALSPDDDAYVATRRQGADVVISCEAQDVPALRRAVDDALATLGVSEDLASQE